MAEQRRVEIFSAGCTVCRTAIAKVMEKIDPRHDVVVLDLQTDDAAAERAAAYGISAVPAVVVDGSLLACCRNTGPTSEELQAAGLVRSAP